MELVIRSYSIYSLPFDWNVVFPNTSAVSLASFELCWTNDWGLCNPSIIPVYCPPHFKIPHLLSDAVKAGPSIA